MRDDTWFRYGAFLGKFDASHKKRKRNGVIRTSAVARALDNKKMPSNEAYDGLLGHFHEIAQYLLILAMKKPEKGRAGQRITSMQLSYWRRDHDG